MYHSDMDYRETHYKALKDGTIVNSKTDRAITPITKKSGYKQVRLSLNGKVKHVSHHRMVYESWHGSIPEGLDINHINGDKEDNRLDNLEAITPLENQARRLYLRKGESVNTAKLKEPEVIAIRNSTATTKELMAEYSMSKHAINRIKSGVTWKHLL